MRILRRGLDAVDLTARVLAGLCLVGMVGVIVLQVVFRYFLDQSLAWTEETSRFLFIGLSFLGIALAHRRSAHSGYSSLVTRLPVPVRRVTILAVDLVGIVFFVLIGLSGQLLVEAGGTSTAPATGVTMFWIYLVFPLCAGLGVLFGLEHLFTHVRGDASTLIAADEDRAMAEEVEGAAEVGGATEPAGHGGRGTGKGDRA